MIMLPWISVPEPSKLLRPPTPMILPWLSGINLEIITVMDGKGNINENGGVYKGQDRYEARKNVIADLEKGGYLVRTEPYAHNVGQCYRCKTDIEPMVSKQWFVKIKPLGQTGDCRSSQRKDKNYSQHMGSHLF